MSPESSEPEPAPRTRVITWVSLILLSASLLGPIAFVGLWDPPELAGAEYARRIAVHAFGASELAIEGATNELPSVEEVGRGELPLFLSAVGFLVFGLHDWAGRLPIALFALGGALGFHFVCRRLAGPRQAALGTMALASTPLFFVQGRTLLGDGVTMACSALSFAALLLCFADRRLGRTARLGAFALGLAALALGTACRGALVGIAVPALAVGLAWWLVGPPLRLPSGAGRAWSLPGLLGACTLCIGVAGFAVGVHALYSAETGRYARLLGSMVRATTVPSTHDFVVHHLGHALFPWSAFLPVALGLALARPRDPESSPPALPVALSFSAVVAMGVHTWMAPRVGPVPFSAPYALAGIAALAILELDRARRGVPVVAMCTAAFAIVLFADFRHFPDKSMSAFVVAKASVPEAFQDATKLMFALATAPVLLATVVLAIEHWPGVRRVSAWLAETRFAPVRSRLLVTALTASGLMLAFGYYPALAAHVSPVGVFETYQDKSRPGEPLATTGKGGNVSAYYGAGERRHFDNERDALGWLAESREERRWLIVKKSDLPSLTSRYRQTVPGKTLPVLDSSSGDVLLVSNLLRDGEVNRNPLARYLPETAPQPKNPVTASFGEKLRVIGWEMTNPSTGKVVSELVRGRRYRIHLYYEVLDRITQNWKTFVHMDSSSNRVNADHDTLEDAYAFRLWNRGDFIADEHVFELEPDVVPGRYTLHFGFYNGKSRLDVSVGGDRDDRVIGGPVMIK